MCSFGLRARIGFFFLFLLLFTAKHTYAQCTHIHQIKHDYNPTQPNDGNDNNLVIRRERSLSLIGKFVQKFDTNGILIHRENWIKDGSKEEEEKKPHINRL